MLRAARFYGTKNSVPMHLKHTVVDTLDHSNLVPRTVPPLDAAKMPKGNLMRHVLAQYTSRSPKYCVELSGWQKLLGEQTIKLLKLDTDRIRSGPVAGAIYRDQCKMQAYFEKDVQLSPTASFYYERLGMPQTFFQWFQVTSLHVWMLYVRMRVMPRRYCREYQRKLINGIFDDIDYQLREVLRVNSDRTVNNYKKQFSQQLRGSIFGYDEGFVSGDAELAGALWRNLFHHSTVADMTILEHLVHFVRAQLYVLERMSDMDFAAGVFQFLDPRFRYEPLTESQNDALRELIESTRKESNLAATESRLARDGW